MFRFCSYVIGCVLALSAFSLRAALPLAANGKPVASIVVPEKSDVTLDYAAQELQLWIKNISGAELPIVKSGASAGGQIVLDPASVNFPADAKQFKGNDGYSVRQKDNKVYLNAGCSKGILNGVFRMLYKNSDIIWARPNPEFGTIFTPDKNFTLTKTDYIDIPKFLLRGWQMPPAYKDKSRYSNFIWQTRNGTNWNSLENSDPVKIKFGTILEDGGGHNIVGRFIREKKYFKTHPEFYPLKNGKRMQPSKHKGSVQLCFTNQEMVKAFIHEVDERVRRNPHFSTYRIMNEDNRNLCECPECMKPVVLADGTTVDVKDPAFRSTQFFLFLNQVGRHFKAKYPEKRILTFAYLFTVIPPKCRVEDNIDISFAPISKDAKFDITAPQSAKTMKQFMNWIKITRNITLREYYGLGGDFPRAIDKTAFGDWQYMYKHGVRRTYSEMRGDFKYPAFLANPWDINSMQYWVLTQGCWDPMQDYKALRMEFLTRVYGAEAAPDIAEFYELIGNSWLKLTSRSIWNEVAHTAWQEAVISKPKLVAACRAALKRAEGKVKPAGKKHFAALKAAFDVHMNFEAKKLIVGKRTSGNPGLDPDFSTAAWVAAPVHDQFFHNTGAFRHPNKTEVRMLFDDKNIYVGVKCEFPNVKKMKYRPLRAGKNAVPHGEGFEVIFSYKSGKKTNLIHLATDPSGNRFSGGRKVNWKHEVKITDYGWCALFTVPWKDLKLTPATAGKMRGQFIRQYNQLKEEGKVPWTAAILFSGRRRQSKYYHPLEFK
ncbi:MAG: DUF4838 domain-containing protein [Lentisphaerae bacterium]|nr:DUF4838 domain-containing protein [Lentisphaerota bacterium]